MIYWMSEETEKVIDGCGVAVYGFDPDRQGEDAECILEFSDGDVVSVPIGDVRGLADAEIDRRFTEACAAAAEATGNPDLACLAERLESGWCVTMAA